MAVKLNLTEEERAARIKAAKQRYAEKKKAERAALKAAGVTITDVIKPDFEKLYIEECSKTRALENKVTDLEKLCKAFSEKERQATAAMHKATLEYNARINYMLECTKHAYISMQFAVKASDKEESSND